MKKKIKILNIVAIILFVFQILSYLGNLNTPKNTIVEKSELIGYYFGFNLAIVISVVLFIIAYSLKRKLKQNTTNDMIDLIGKPE
jgi:hypothetical protein